MKPSKPPIDRAAFDLASNTVFHGNGLVTKPSKLKHAFTLAIAFLMAVVLVTSPGCSCFQKPKTAAELAEEKRKKEEEEKKKKKPKPNFEISRPEVLPAAAGPATYHVKPGHWASTRQEMIANNFEFNAEIYSAVTESGGRPIDVERTPFYMTMLRPAPLPKGKVKQFDNIYYVPRSIHSQSESVHLQSKLRARHGGREVARGSSTDKTTRMPDHQYYFVVLSDKPDNYGFLKTLDCIHLRQEDYLEKSIRSYVVALPKLDGRPPLPDHPLTWTSIAVVVWDNSPPSALLPAQQDALLDWLQWGGQLIISGPRSIDSLRGSFLDAYLPADPVESITLDDSAFAEMNEYWSLTPQKGERELIAINPKRPSLGVELKLRPGAVVAPHTGGLVVEKRIGRGRITMTKFALTDRQLTNWGNLDGFFNGCLLRRPARKFRLSMDTLSIDSQWESSAYRGFREDARFNTSLRYFSRDIGHQVATAPRVITATENGNVEMDFQAVQKAGNGGRTRPSSSLPEVDASWDQTRYDARFGGFATTGQSGVAGWNDFSGAAEGARQSLKDAAGISIPKAGFVLKVLAIYLAVLVPINWLFFRLIGRVEWAWIAAPLIAIVGAVVVVRTAQLDIGFARSRTEVAILELQPDYPRAHLTRFTALYTSLSTSYSASYEDDSALAQPFAVDPDFRRQPGVRATEVTLQRERNITLSGFRVASNSTGMLHSEEMYGLSGPVSLTQNANGGLQVDNQTDLEIQDAAVLRRVGDQYEVAWLGQVKPKTAVGLTFEKTPTPHANKWDASWVTSTLQTEAEQARSLYDKNGNGVLTRQELQGRPDLLEQFEAADDNENDQLEPQELYHCCRKARSGRVSLGALFELASKRLVLQSGEMRLIGWTEQPLDSMVFSPGASQVESRALVLAHLRYADLPDPVRDANRRSDFTDEALKETDPNAVLFPEQPGSETP